MSADTVGNGQKQSTWCSLVVSISCQPYSRCLFLGLTIKPGFLVGKGPPVTPIVPGIEPMRTTSLATSVEEISTPISKKPRLADKGNKKADSHLSNVWDDAGLAVEKVNEFVTVEDLKVFSGMPSNENVTCHVHKLV